MSSTFVSAAFDRPAGGRSRPRHSAARGFVLPVVLVMLVVMTTAVTFLVRRGTVDERIASNVRGTVALDAAATYGLRHCEMWLWFSPPGRTPGPGRPSPPKFIGAPLSTATTPAWRAANWNADSVALPTQSLGTDVSRGRCLIEDATGELELFREFVEGNQLAFDQAWRKYRITVEIEGPSPTGTRTARAQSEVRMYIN